MGTRIRFLRTLEEGPDDFAPGYLYATKGETGEVTRVGGCREGFWVKTDNWDAAFGCSSEEFEVTE